MIYRPTIPDLEKEEADRLALLCLRAELWSYCKPLRESDEDGSWKAKGSEVGQIINLIHSYDPKQLSLEVLGQTSTPTDPTPAAFLSCIPSSRCGT